MLTPFELLLSSVLEELAPVTAWVAGAVADTVDTTGALRRCDALRLAAFAETCFSSLDSSARVFVICALRPWASVTREWILVVVALGVVVVAISPETELGAALPMSAAAPPMTAPPVTTAVTRNDRPLIGPPIALSSSDCRRASGVEWVVRIALETHHTR
jgi:hypothetical protein